MDPLRSPTSATAKCRRLPGIIGICMVLVMMAACAGEQPAGEHPLAHSYINVQGSDTMVNLVSAWAEAYMDTFPGEIAATGGGSGTGISAIINNTTDIAASSRPMTETERTRAEDNQVEVWAWIVGQDGLAVAVHPDNPTTGLTMAELKAVFTGQLTQWSQLGWDQGRRISIYSRQPNSGTYVFFRDHVLDGEDWAAGTRQLSGSAAINIALQQDRGGIGYYGVGYVDGVKALDIGVTSRGPFYSPLAPETINSGEYPLARPLYFYTNGVPNDLVLAFLRFVLAPEHGQRLITDAGFYSITPEHAAANRQQAAAAGIELTFTLDQDGG